MKKPVFKQVLSNGLTILVKEAHVVPKVSTQLWYNVGSKDEKSGQKGIAHLIEHMIFKGTKKLSECDINLITHKLSGYTNAFTSYDYTGYLFDFPSQHWLEALPIMADCMHNATFKEEHLASELKAVIQELKMYRDDYASTLIEALTSAIFADHPYHHPIIGYKQDLWNLHRSELVNFYTHHYLPNNATLVVVGDVDAQAVVKQAEKEFGPLEPNFGYTKEHFYHGSDLKTQAVTVYRDVKIPICIVAWVIPGAVTKNEYVVDLVTWIIGSGKGSRLYKKLVDELQLATDLEAFNYDLFDYGLVFVYFQPKEIVHIDRIIAIIHEELARLADAVVTEVELMRAIKQAEMEHLTLLENNQKQAYALGKFYLATGDEQYLYTFTEQPKEGLAQQIKEFFGSHMRPSLMHKGMVLPLAAEDKKYWVQLQEISDAEDQRILSRRTREEEVEAGRCVAQVAVKEPKSFTFARATTLHLENGLKILYSHNPQLPKIDIIVDFEARHTYDPVDKQGLGSFVAALLLEGTKNYTAENFATTAESYGMTIQSVAGQIVMSMLAVDLAKGLELLHEMVAYATFSPEAVEKVRDQMLAELDEFWDAPMQFSVQLVRQEIYKKHPYAKNQLGTIEGIKQITPDDIVSYYKTYISPRAARLSLVGDVERYDIKPLFESILGSWMGPAVAPLDFPPLEPVTKHDVVHTMLRDQTVLCYGALSVTRMDPDFDKLLLFDQIFTGGVLGSMASRLFDLREQSGLFYTIGGTLLAKCDEQPGLILVKTIVSNDRRKEAEVAIEYVIDTAINEVSDDEFYEARQAIINSLVDNFATNQSLAATLLFVDRFNLPADYYDKRAHNLSQITKEEMQQTVRKYLDTQRFVLVRVGRE